MLISIPILTPLVVLVAWSMVMWLWMYVTRLPAMMAMDMKPDPNAPRGEQMNTLPASVRWKADNYNHLMEQPTVFYAIVLALALLGYGEGINLVLAWAYVGIRIAHSILQAVVNKIEVRFLLFLLSSLALIGLTFNALRIVLW
ncbi:MAG: MAPEG family protein [Pseudomonadota bacterium]|uniref:MAPEG family protein n=1 Tax=Alcanivorax sp. TaxID=1872427 RepID=UPI0025B89441|nr:MAPEG family protein [Alcanivorax sp.]MED5239753.1 MAPEG family protein [Pseudomonadota bacterium]MEE3319763.1 MAPEG family protein [Pseudomonadota bacterium]